jgi:myogenesis-regulating glycosidase
MTITTTTMQMWPLNGAALELGPFYPFDNGPNGINTLVGHHWVATGGLLAAIDPDTPYLHVSMNSPLKGRKPCAAGGFGTGADGPGMGGRKKRKWGVGIQNAGRELLPLAHLPEPARSGRPSGDGVLTVQASKSYYHSDCDHPMRGWVQGASSLSDDDDDALLPPPPGALTVRMALCATSDVKAATMLALSALEPPQQVRPFLLWIVFFDTAGSCSWAQGAISVSSY